MSGRCKELLTALALCSAAGAQTFVNVAEQAGLRFALENSASERKHMIETMTGGVAVFDYDNDGRADIFFANGAPIPSLKKSDPKYSNRLFRNEGGWRFRDVTEQAGVAGAGYDMGAAAGDFDNDGRVDLFVAGVHRNTLFRNLGGGKFADVTEQAGIKPGEWSVAAGWLDYDNDGRLDLFVVNYLKWDAGMDIFCGDRQKGVRVYCHPKMYQGTANTLYRNRGDGSFEDVSVATGIAKHAGKGMSTALADFDGDGFVDIFVTNDKVPNYLFRNVSGKRFEETALLAGVALADHGKPISSMGAEARDYDNDGLPDIVHTALTNELFPLFRNRGKGSFQDVTYRSGLGPLCAKYSGWTVVLADLDNDGWKDLFTSNSHVNDRIEVFEPTTYAQPNTVFFNRKGQFTVQPFGEARAHRGGAVADFDGDGRLDMVVTAYGSNAELWRNELPGSGRWLGVKLRGTKSNRDGIGAVVRVAGQMNHMSTASGYASSAHTPVHFGLGEASRADVEIRWPSGTVQVIKGVAAGQVIEATEP